MAYTALAVGYVVESLTAAPSASTPEADERDENDEGRLSGVLGDDSRRDDCSPHKSDSDTTTGTEPDAESRLSTGIGDSIDVATDDDRNQNRTETAAISPFENGIDWHS